MLDLGPTDYHDPDGTGWRQREPVVTVRYDHAYLAKYDAIGDRVRVLARRRLAVLEAFVPRGPLLDYGCGVNALVAEAADAYRGWEAFGTDVVNWDPSGRFWSLPEATYYPRPWQVVTFFDVLEHLPDPAAVVRDLAPAWVMASVPNCHHPRDWAWFGKWKHRRPGEHLWAWGPKTLDAFFARLGYRPVVHSSFEDAYRPNPDQPEPNILTAIYRRA